MEELLQILEKKIRQLIDQHDQRQYTAQQLHPVESHHNENEIYLLKQQKAITQIENLINKLKAIESMT